MSETNITLKSKKNQYHHLNLQQRTVIETLASQKDGDGKRMFSNSYIANYIGVHKSTISRELRKRPKVKFIVRSGKTKVKPYNAIDAQNDYMFKRGLSKGEYKLNKYPEMKKFIENKILKDKWAPDVIVGYMKNHGYFQKEAVL